MIAAVLVGAVAVFVYSASLPGTFLYDDMPTIVWNPSVSRPHLIPQYFTDAAHFSGIVGNEMYRPVLLVSYAVDSMIAGFRPFVWHLTNVLLHALNAALLVLLTFRLLGVLRPGRAATTAAVVAGLFFALHPVQSEVVNYVSSRSGSIATAGFLLGLLFYCGFRRREASRARRGWMLALSILSFLAGMGGKEIAISLVAVVPALEILDPAGASLRERLRRTAVRTAPLLLAAVFCLWVRSLVLDHSLGGLAHRIVHQRTSTNVNSGAGRSVWQNLMTQTRVFWMYVGLVLAPVRLAVDRFVTISASWLAPAVAASTLGILGLVAGLTSQWRRHPILPLAGAILFFGLAPTSLIPLNVVMNEHRLYLPMVGISIIAGVGAAGLLAARPRLGRALCGAVAVCFAVLVVARSLTWQDPRALWEANVRDAPRSFRAHNQLGALHYDAASTLGSVPAALPELNAAIAEFDTAVGLYPNWYDPHLNLGMAWREHARITGSDEEFSRSISEFTRCTELSRNPWRARYQLASTYGTWKKYDEAVRRFEELASEDRAENGRRKTIYLYPMARLRLEQGQLEDAERLYREIVTVSPEDPDGYSGLAQTLATSGKPGEGAEVLRGYVARRPQDPDASLRLAQYLLSIDPPDRKAARAAFERAVALGHRPTPPERVRFLGK